MNHDPENFDQVQKLLRLKRYEQPRPGYHEDFLREFQSRQRSDILRRPLRELIWERIEGLVPTFHVPGYAYGAAMALFFGVAMVVTQFDQETPIDQAEAIASSGPEAVSSTAGRTHFALNHEPDVELSGLEQLRTLASSIPSKSRHYVLQSTPVSYERPAGF